MDLHYYSSRSAKVVAKSIAKHYSQQNTKIETGEALNKKTKIKHHTKQNNKTLNNTNTTRKHKTTTHKTQITSYYEALDTAPRQR